MPIHAPTLLTDLKKWVTRFEDDLRQQCKDVPALDTRLKAQYKLAEDAGRTAFAYTVWRDGELTQSAVGWVLSCVFVRFLEDNDLLERTYLSGVGENREVADETRAAYFRENRAASDNDYLAHVMSEVGKLPGMADLMDARHNALWNASISPDAAKAFIEFWRRIDPGTGKMAHEFTDPDWDTRFLGDLYQDLSESARKKFALLQTPDFVEEFILDRTLDPAINTFGLKVVRMIDPTCGSGHFLLGGFRRLLALWEKERPDLSDKERAVKALDGVYGVDINPFAVAIARFRLLLAAWRYCGVKRLRSAPDFKVNLAVGDSLLHGARFDAEGKPYTIGRESLFGGDELVFKDETAHNFEVEDAKELHRILGQQYHAVVGNPPYITVKDKALNELYRKRYDACSGKYALSVPFMERFFDLAISGGGDGHAQAGFQGQITSNSYMKREFGKKIIEQFIRNWDLTHVIDTSGAYIPGHGTPTVILYGRNVKPKTTTVRTVMGIKGEPATPEDPANGLVWTSIVDQIDRPGSESDFVSVADTEREKFHNHPWSIGGGGAAELKVEIEEEANVQLGKVVDQLRGKPNIGITSFTLEDDLFIQPQTVLTRSGLDSESIREMIEGDTIRDWFIGQNDFSVWPYDSEFTPVLINHNKPLLKFMWHSRTCLSNNKMFGGKTKVQTGLTWYEFGRLTSHKLKTPLSITFAAVVTHNQFVLDRGGKVFKQSAPVIKLPPDASEDDHLRLLGLLNSSTACFWIKQVFYPKATTTGDISVEKGKPEANRYDIAGTGLQNFPLPDISKEDSDALVAMTAELDRLATEVSSYSGNALTEKWQNEGESLAELIGDGEQMSARIRRRMTYLQEELDWLVYKLYGLIDQTFSADANATIDKADRPYLWAKDSAPGSLAPELVEAYTTRKKLISESPNLGLIETPVFKRPWLGRQGVYGSASRTYPEQAKDAVGAWLLTRLETYFHEADRMVSGKDEAATAAKLAHIRQLRARFAGGTEPRLVSVRQLAQAAQADSQWMEAATVFAGRADFDVAKLVETLVLAESVPALPGQRYKPAGLRKREEWEKTWELQRAEDAVEEEVRGQKSGVSEEELKKKIRKAQLEKVGDIPVPPKYGSGDFLKSTYWKLRGKLDVPKERWVLYPGMEGGHDASPVIAWAGWDHAQQAAALTAFYQQAKDTWGWAPERLAPLLAALKDLLPWLHQWHNAIDPEYGDRPCDSFQQFYTTELHALRMTDEDIEKIRMGGGN
jgi:hypothetical protein